MKKVTEEQAVELEATIEELELHDKSEEEIERVISGFSGEALKLRRERKGIRYQLYRLKGEAEGRTTNVSEEGFKEKFESQLGFDGWRNFSQTWDVAMDDPYRVVSRSFTVQEEWDEVVKAKFPSIKPGGQIVYPDITVRKKVEAEAKLQKAAKKKAKKKSKKKGNK